MGAISLKFCEPETLEPAVDSVNIGVNSNKMYKYIYPYNL